MTCQEYASYDTANTRPLSTVLKDIKLTNVPTRVVNNLVIGCNRSPKLTNMRLKLPFTEQIISYDSCSCNELVSLLNRHLNTNEHLVGDYLPIAAFKYYTRLHPPQFLKLFTVKQVLLSKRPSKRRTYINAYKSLCVKPLNDLDTRVKMFVKNERMSLRDPLKPPRAIQSRSPRYNLCHQRFVLAIGKHLVNKPLNDRVVTKGMNQFQIASWFNYHWSLYQRPSARLLDHAFYDSKQNSKYTLLTNIYMAAHFPGDNDYWRLFLPRLLNNCISRTGISYRVRATKCSGDGDTSDGNSILNDVIITWYCRLLHQYSHCLVGDDSTIIHDSSDDNFDEYALKNFGFDTKINDVTEFEKIEYCQCQPVNTVNGWLMVRNPLRVMSRATTCINHSINTIKLFRRWCVGVGECEYSVNPGVPILQSFARFMMRASCDKPIYDETFEYRRMKGQYCHEITSSCRQSFARAFDITPHQQLDIEHYFDNLNWDVELSYVSFPTAPTIAVF